MVTEAPEAPADGPVPAPNPNLARRAARSTVEWVLIIAAALVVAVVVKTFLFQAFLIPSASMQPELRIRDRILVNKLSYRLHDFNRGDVVVFERPDCGAGEGTKDLVKRVIGLPGETVEGRDGSVFVDGRRLGEAYLPPGIRTEIFTPVQVPAGHLWVMGDNRGNSKDSRAICGFPTFIPEDRVIGRAFVRVWPPNRLGLL